MEEFESVSFQMISAVGMARSMYIEAIQKAKEKDFEAAKDLMKQGKDMFIQGHHAHAELIQKEANGEKTEFALLLMHAEDQLMSAEAFGILANEFIDVYKAMASN